MVEDGVRLAEVSEDGGGPLVPVEDLQAVGDRSRVEIHVHHPGVRSDRLGDLVDVALGGNARAEVEELPYAGLGEVAHRPAEEGPVGPRHGADERELFEEL